MKSGAYVIDGYMGGLFKNLTLTLKRLVRFYKMPMPEAGGTHLMFWN
jgi:hypothetical protein